MIRIGRTLPPAAAPISFFDIVNGFKGIAEGEKEINRFQHELRSFFSVNHCFLTSSGKTALTIILRALEKKHPKRRKVIVPAYNCYSVPSAISRAGLEMVLCEMEPDTLDFNYNYLANLLGVHESLAERQKKQGEILAVVPTHFFGIPSEIHRLREILSDSEITVIEDAAQSLGENCGGSYQGRIGDVGFFSLGRGKALSLVEGGVILTKSDVIAEQIKLLMQDIPPYSFFGVMSLIVKAITLQLFMNPHLFWIPRSLPFLKLGETLYDAGFPMNKLSSFQAGISRNWQKKLARFQEIRKNNVNIWLDHLPEAYWPFLKKYKQTPPASIRFPLRIEDEKVKNLLKNESDRCGLGVMPTYPDSLDTVLVSQQEQHCDSFPGARKLCRELITLPVHPFVTQQDIEKICQIILTNST